MSCSGLYKTSVTKIFQKVILLGNMVSYVKQCIYVLQYVHPTEAIHHDFLGTPLPTQYIKQTHNSIQVPRNKERLVHYNIVTGTSELDVLSEEVPPLSCVMISLIKHMVGDLSISSYDLQGGSFRNFLCGSNLQILIPPMDGLTRRSLNYAHILNMLLYYLVQVTPVHQFSMIFKDD